MKCDELKDYDIMDIEAMDDERLEKSESSKIQVTRVCIKSDVDAAIAELKDIIKNNQSAYYVDLGIVANDCEKLKAENERLTIDKRNVELRADVADSTIEKLKKKMDDYHLMSDIRRAKIKELKRALWLARASDASSFAGLFSTLSYIEDDESRKYWIFGNKRKIVFDGLKCSRMETAYKWFCIWDDVANKCLKKAKEYK